MNAKLPATTANGQARLSALSFRGDGARIPTSLVAYRSTGFLLIIGPEHQAMPLAERLKDKMNCSVLATDSPTVGEAPGLNVEDAESPADERSTRVLRVPLSDLKGHLGQYTVTVSLGEDEINLAHAVAAGREHFDLVLDLSQPARIRSEIPPPGYYAPGEDADALERALCEIPQMVGEFEKPKYFNYNPSICAHGNSGLTGCTRCLVACPTDAIKSLGETIGVDPYLCQGAGTCATACPTGAISYAYPRVDDLLKDIRELLKRYREAGGDRACILFHDAEMGREWIDAKAPSVPERVIPVEVEEIGSVGIDTWLTTLAYGASEVVVLTAPDTTASVRGELEMQLSVTQAVLEGLNYSSDRVRTAGVHGEHLATETSQALSGEYQIVPASFEPLEEKRTTIRLALDHLYEHSDEPQRHAALPSGAPFGEIRVNRDACTLCMACVSVCPTSALEAGGDLPQLRFIEWNCVQCGLCETACPENAVRLASRVILDPSLRREARILNEERPFHCVVCGKPFATQSIMDRMAEKLKGHWMFQKPEQLRRLHMCEDCRVKDMFRDERSVADKDRNRDMDSNPG